MNLGELLGVLPKLSQQELAAVRAAIDHLLVSQIDELDTTAPLYSAMTALLGVRLSYRDYHNNVNYKTWKRSAPAVVTFIEDTWPEASKVAKLALMTFMLEALIADLKGRGVPISIGTVTLHLARVPQVFEQEFPDYIRSGLAHVVLTAMKKE